MIRIVYPSQNAGVHGSCQHGLSVQLFHLGAAVFKKVQHVRTTCTVLKLTVNAALRDSIRRASKARPSLTVEFTVKVTSSCPRAAVWLPYTRYYTQADPLVLEEDSSEA